jgi:dienelactone hydrolase
MHSVRGRRFAVLVALVVLLIASARGARPIVHGLSFVIRAASLDGAVRRVAELDTQQTSERALALPTPRGLLRGRLYEPVHGARRTILLTSGLHPAGINEPRLVALARQLTASGVAVFTPDIPELSTFTITPAITDAIEAAAIGLADYTNSRADRRIGLIGISFSGGLSIVAAGRAALRDRVAYVLAFGGHDDLPRVLQYLCTGIEPAPVRLKPDATNDVRTIASPPEDDRVVSARIERPMRAADAMSRKTGFRPNQARYRKPHDYGVAVILLGVADRAVPPVQADALRGAVRRFLWASHLDRVDKPLAEREFAALREVAARLPEPSATLLRYVNDRDVLHLGERLLPYIEFYGHDPALSPSMSPKPSAPVFLLHGIDDNVIPMEESEYLADDLRGHAPTRLLLSGLISHAEADQPVHAGDVMRLASFWGDLLAR